MGLEEVGHAQFLNSVCPVNYEAVTQVALKEQIKNILLNGKHYCHHDHVIL